MKEKIVEDWLSLAQYDLATAYIESRYTEDIQELAAILTEAKAGAILKSTREVFAWIRSKL